MEKPTLNIEPLPVDTPLFNKLLKVFGYAIAIIIGLILFLYFFFQIDFVQNLAVKEAAKYFSKELKTTVTLDKISLDFFDKLVLENFYVADFHNDTLLYSKSLTINLNTNIVKLLQRDLKVEDLTLSNAKFYMRRYPNEQKDDFAQLLDRLGSSKEIETDPAKKNAKPFFLDVGALYLQEIEFIKSDSVGGENLSIALSEGAIIIDTFNLAKKIVLAKSVTLSNPYVTLINFDKNLLPPIPLDSTALIHPPISNKPLLSEPDSIQKKWRINMANFALIDGIFIHHNYRKSPIKTTAEDEMDFNHLNVFDINIEAADFSIYDWVFTGESKKLSLKEGSGFVLDNLSTKKGLISTNRIELYDMALITPYSNLGDTLIMKFKKYPDFKDFPNKVSMDAKFKKAYIAIQDIMAFAPALSKNTFFAKNKDEIFHIDGRLKGKINNLKGRSLNIRLGKNFQLKGNFNSRNLTQSDETFLSLKLDRLRTNMQTLRQLIPNFNLPKNFDKLGGLNFKGRFDGFFIDFVANGNLETDLGIAAMDMNLNTRKGKELAQYSGQLSLTDFDLARWTGNKDFGLVTFSSKVYDGIGLTPSTADAKLKASIDHFAFKGYNYDSLSIEGVINRNLFIGDFGIHDDNIDFLFDGTINFEESIPFFDFYAKVNRVDLKSLNLMPDDYVVAGNINLKIRGNNINDLLGRATLYDLLVTHNQKEEYRIDSLKFSSAITHSRKKAWRANSEVFKATLVGDFQVPSIGEAILQYIENNFTGYANRFNIHSKRDTSIKQNQFAFDLEIIDSKNFTYLLNKDFDTLKNINLHTYFDFAQDTMAIDLVVPTFQFGTVKTKKVKLLTQSWKKEGKIDFSVLNAKVGELNFDYVSLLTYIENNSAAFNINIADVSNELDKFNVDGKFTMAGEQFHIEFLPSDLVILNTDWKMAKNNYLEIGKNFIKTQNFQISQDNKKIALYSLSDTGLALEVSGFNTNYIDSLWDYDKLNFEGAYQLKLQIEDLFTLERIQLEVVADTFHINKDNYGTLRLNASTPNIKSPIDIRLSTLNEELGQQMELTGFYNSPNVNIQPQTLTTSPNYVNVEVKITKYPLHLAEYFVTNGISNTIGNIDAALSLNGLLADPNLNGTIRVYEGATTLDYTNTRYTIIDETVKMNNEFMLDVTGGTIYDVEGNKAVLTGGITHDFFKNLGLDCRVESDHFTILNTHKGDNEIYYGQGIGKGNIYFSGDLNRTNIDIKATTAKGTRISIPVTGESAIEEASFIRFEIEDTTQIAKKLLEKSNEIKGIKLAIELEMTEEAEVLLIFDEKAGDIMSGRGYGNIKMDMTRSGDISMYGNYEIEEGKYLFTLLNIVNKPFIVKRGGTINWTGDPYNAFINIDAEYKGLSTSPYNFIIEYLNEDEVKAEARKTTPVDLTMGLSGPLLTPNIAFSIDFPELTDELKNYTDNKIRSIEFDQNELNKQVFGLIAIGSFLPSDQGALAGNQSKLAINTLSELLSSQLSIYLTEVLSQGLSSIDFLALEDFDVTYSQYDAATIDNPNNLATGHEFLINPKFRVKDRWVVNIAGKANLGGGYVTNNSSDALVTGDFIVEYELTKDRRLKIRGYYKNEPEILGGRKNNTGVGLSFRKEFDGFEELFSFLKKPSNDAPKTLSKREKEDEFGNR